MLKHEDTSQMQPQAASQPAAQVRVTPEELAAAITALQIRKEGQPGTITIGDAVEELGLDVTPEEVLAEVQARQTMKKRPSLQVRLLVLSTLGLAVLGGVVMTQHLDVNPSGDASSVAATYPIPSTSPMPVYVKASSNLVVRSASGKLVMLSEVGDNQPVDCDYDYSSSSFVSYSPDAGFAYTLVKHEGKVYLRGGMPQMSAQVLQKDGADITWDIDSVCPVTLPLSGFQVIPGQGNEMTGFHAVNIHLDKHAYEKW